MSPITEQIYPIKCSQILALHSKREFYVEYPYKGQLLTNSSIVLIWTSPSDVSEIQNPFYLQKMVIGFLIKLFN